MARATVSAIAFPHRQQLGYTLGFVCAFFLHDNCGSNDPLTRDSVFDVQSSAATKRREGEYCFVGVSRRWWQNEVVSQARIPHREPNLSHRSPFACDA